MRTMGIVFGQMTEKEKLEELLVTIAFYEAILAFVVFVIIRLIYSKGGFGPVQQKQTLGGVSEEPAEYQKEKMWAWGIGIWVAVNVFYFILT